MSIPPTLKRRTFKPQTQTERGEEVGKLIEEEKMENNPYTGWLNPLIEDVPRYREELRKFIFSLNPIFLPNVIKYMMERIRHDNMAHMNELWAQMGGWGSVKRDLQKASRWIEELYGVGVEEEG